LLVENLPFCDLLAGHYGRISFILGTVKLCESPGKAGGLPIMII
jgi:hypothetical protein